MAVDKELVYQHGSYEVYLVSEQSSPASNEGVQNSDITDFVTNDATLSGMSNVETLNFDSTTPVDEPMGSPMWPLFMYLLPEKLKQLRGANKVGRVVGGIV